MGIDRLEEVRLCALNQLIDADLCLGRHREVLSELTLLVGLYRLHEPLHRKFMWRCTLRAARRGAARPAAAARHPAGRAGTGTLSAAAALDPDGRARGGTAARGRAPRWRGRLPLPVSLARSVETELTKT
jgi:transcriptional activator